MKHSTFIREVLVGMGGSVLCISAACAAAPEEAEEHAVAGDVSGRAAELSTQEEVTGEKASALVAQAGQCRGSCCNGWVSPAMTTPSARACMQWVKSMCENREGVKRVRFNGVLVPGLWCN
ncbi:hypothetical protein [Polyangium spumosum]|uniref:Lipoprotein n=1 Tax=Polyangium spumosum TaxID=889282 RepID=A0A6N7PLQ4_9BACT|nr:hypothetical protein [Polyangium spumosum]MRG91180.1 hypothetical protein [Polyangium spumosum]